MKDTIKIQLPYHFIEMQTRLILVQDNFHWRAMLKSICQYVLLKCEIASYRLQEQFTFNLFQ